MDSEAGKWGLNSMRISFLFTLSPSFSTQILDSLLIPDEEDEVDVDV